MNFILKKYQHAPTHLFIEISKYFFTGAIYQKQRLLTGAKTKEIFIEQLIRFIKKYNWELLEWIVLENHYHFLAQVTNSSVMPKVINTIHKTSAFYIKKELKLQTRPFWYQYWDRCIRNDKHFYETAMYILYNPIKHHYVDNLRDYPFSSFHIRLQQEEQELKNKFIESKPQSIHYYDDIDNF